jgi:TldD protein
MINQTLQTAQATLLEPTGLQVQDLDNLFGRLMEHDVDYADVYFQHSRSESWSLEDGTVKSGSRSIDQGVGIRAISGEKTGFAYSDEFHLGALKKAADAAKSIARLGGKSGEMLSWKGDESVALYNPADPLSSLPEEAKVALLQDVEAEARRQDSRVVQVMASLAAVHDVVLIARNDGNLVADIRPLIRLNVHVIVESNGRREQGSAGGGGRFGYTYLLEEERALSFARDAVRQAVINLESVDSPAGTMTVVLGSGWPGILLHEAIGHGLEGDFNRKGTSAFSERLGERVATPECTVVDNGTIIDRRGSLTIDDEGTPTQNTVLIEDGVLKGYMQDTLNARLSGVAPTGNGRRESYAHLPMPRMTNTYMLAGNMDPEEIIASVGRGLYAVNFGGGQVDITSGKFVFSASEAYRIENGKVTAPVKGATLIGNGPDVLNRVTMVGSDLELDPGVGTCGKEGQSVPVGVGQPTLRINDLTVGGVAV